MRKIRRSREPNVEEIMGYVALYAGTENVQYERRKGNKIFLTSLEDPNKSYSITFDGEGNMNIEDYEVVE